MDVTFVLSAAIFTLLAIVVATSLFRGSSPRTDVASSKSCLKPKPKPKAAEPKAAGGLDAAAAAAAAGAAAAGPTLNGHVAEEKAQEADMWGDMSGSSHDHWDVVKSVLSEEDQPSFYTEEATIVEHSTSTASSLSVPCPESRHMSLEVDTSSEASSGRSHRSFIGLSETELLQCAFSSPQTEGATEGPGINEEKVESDDSSSLRYIPGKARTHHLEMMMSKEELEEEQRVQREQLVAIFQLLQDNKETFGDVSEGDLEEQLRLYSI